MLLIKLSYLPSSGSLLYPLPILIPLFAGAQTQVQRLFFRPYLTKKYHRRFQWPQTGLFFPDALSAKATLAKARG